MAIIKVPKTPPSSFNKDRRPSKLLLDQIAHLEWAALPAWQRKPQLMKKYKKRQVKTEQEAAERIAQLTEMVMKANEERAQPAEGVRPTVVLPPVPRKARKAKKAGKTRKAAKTRKAVKTQMVRRTAKAETTKKKAARARKELKAGKTRKAATTRKAVKTQRARRTAKGRTTRKATTGRGR